MSCSTEAARQGFRLVLAQFEVLRQFHRIHAHALQVLAGGFVFRFDGQRERFNGPQVQA